MRYCKRRNELACLEVPFNLWTLAGVRVVMGFSGGSSIGVLKNDVLMQWCGELTFWPAPSAAIAETFRARGGDGGGCSAARRNSFSAFAATTAIIQRDSASVSGKIASSVWLHSRQFICRHLRTVEPVAGRPARPRADRRSGSTAWSSMRTCARGLP